MSDFRVVICGGGIAATEGLLRLRRLAGDAVDIHLVAPGDELVYRPMSVREPFAFGPAARHPLGRIAADADAHLLRDSLAWVDRDERVVHTAGGTELPYDALLIAVGARQYPGYAHVGTFRDGEADETFQGIVQDVEGGYARRIAFLVPGGPVYPLPIYELALMTAERARSMGIDDADLVIVTPEPGPLAAFGREAEAAMASLLERAGVTVYTGASAHVPSAGRVIVSPPGVELHPDRAISLPRLGGPNVRGLAGGGAHGFLPIDAECRVPHTDGRVFAAGDAAAFPIKHGGLGAQMADSAAAGIARLAGVPVERAPFRPVIRGKVLTGGSPLYLGARLVGNEGFESEVHDTPPWPSGDKVVAEELGPYLARQVAGGRSPAAAV